MSGISNYERHETVATGFVRPKVTALFFDKIWVPKSLLQTTYDFFIPEQVLIYEEKELTIGTKTSGIFYEHEILRNRPFSIGERNDISAGDFYKIKSHHNVGTTLHTIEDILEHEKDLEFKYSKNRNNAIMISSEKFCRKYGIHISPIYHNLTEFERDIESLNLENIYKKDSLKFR